jgi:hypothetical protein
MEFHILRNEGWNIRDWMANGELEWRNAKGRKRMMWKRSFMWEEGARLPPSARKRRLRDCRDAYGSEDARQANVFASAGVMSSRRRAFAGMQGLRQSRESAPTNQASRARGRIRHATNRARSHGGCRNQSEQDAAQRSKSESYRNPGIRCARAKKSARDLCEQIRRSSSGASCDQLGLQGFAGVRRYCRSEPVRVPLSFQDVIATAAQTECRRALRRRFSDRGKAPWWGVAVIGAKRRRKKEAISVARHLVLSRLPYAVARIALRLLDDIGKAHHESNCYRLITNRSVTERS